MFSSTFFDFTPKEPHQLYISPHLCPIHCPLHPSCCGTTRGSSSSCGLPHPLGYPWLLCPVSHCLLPQKHLNPIFTYQRPTTFNFNLMATNIPRENQKKDKSSEWREKLRQSANLWLQLGGNSHRIK